MVAPGRRKRDSSAAVSKTAVSTLAAQLCGPVGRDTREAIAIGSRDPIHVVHEHVD
jgi:hypothetical protein